MYSQNEVPPGSERVVRPQNKVNTARQGIQQQGQREVPYVGTRRTVHAWALQDMAGAPEGCSILGMWGRCLQPGVRLVAVTLRLFSDPLLGTG